MAGASQDEGAVAGEAGSDGARSKLGLAEKLGIGSTEGAGKRRLGRPAKARTKMSTKRAATMASHGRARRS
jgi:hypothetical protein